ncbi:unnamed protein product [Acanthoscelides obtectus]|uniref:Uncharacterized protein n=1 Tax=Acanthoscelides obtectus TaxID=200917 RepID=A0A9P0KLK6_ACAOB|nr:unnamed protein product [Acanthoscelides obtectus]CAK1638188.1 hypothetical protein AOBTE_LOCUS10441 [Acanthoscelides obtectus]
MFFGKTGITVHFEEDDSDNRGNYRKLLTFIAKKDQKCSEHLETSTVFFGRLGSSRDRQHYI